MVGVKQILYFKPDILFETTMNKKTRTQTPALVRFVSFQKELFRLWNFYPQFAAFDFIQCIGKYVYF